MAPDLISVIVPTYQRNDQLAKCLDCLSPGRQTLDRAEYEVIVTDDGIASTAESMLKQDYPWARWVAGPHRGPAANRNNGARSAKGKFIAFVDDDCLPDKNWLAELKHGFICEDAEVVEGKVDIPDRVDNPLLYGVDNLTGGMFLSCNLAFRADRFKDIGGFDEDFAEAGGEDLECCWRVKNRGLRVVYADRALVLHPARRLNLKGLVWKTCLDRWILLYRLKTGTGTSLDEGDLHAVVSAMCSRTINLLRRTSHLFTRGPHKYWRNAIFWLVWDYLTLPFMLPYLAYWELKYRNQMRSKPLN